MGPWAQAVFDTLSAVASPAVVEEVIARGMLEVLPLTHIRGRSLHDSFVIVDEAQSLERNVLLTVLSRLGSNSRVVLTHDVAQRDNLRVGRHDGIAAVIEALKGHPLFAHVTLTRSERSPIAALVTEMLELPDLAEGRAAPSAARRTHPGRLRPGSCPTMDALRLRAAPGTGVAVGGAPPDHRGGSSMPVANAGRAVRGRLAAGTLAVFTIFGAGALVALSPSAAGAVGAPGRRTGCAGGSRPGDHDRGRRPPDRGGPADDVSAKKGTLTVHRLRLRRFHRSLAGRRLPRGRQGSGLVRRMHRRSDSRNRQSGLGCGGRRGSARLRRPSRSGRTAASS